MSNAQNEVAAAATQIDSSMSRFLDMIQNLSGKTWDYAEVQMTETVGQLLVWEFLSACINALVALIILLVCWRVAVSQIKYWRSEYKSEYSVIDPDRDYDHVSVITLAGSSASRFLASVGMAFILFYAGNAFVFNVQKGARIALAPRIYLIEYGVQKYKELKTPTK